MIAYLNLFKGILTLNFNLDDSELKVNKRLEITAIIVILK